MKIIVRQISLDGTLSVTLTTDSEASMSGKRLNKTYLMQLLENRFPGQTIESLMIKAFRQHGSERAAAEALGITAQAFNTWKYRLGLQDTFLKAASVKTPKLRNR